MICTTCEDGGHYWFAEDDQEISKELEELIGVYGYCDMRQVYSTLAECECGCHN